MLYTPDWELMAEAVKRVMARGVAEPEAKAHLCRALADRKIDVRVRVAKTATRYSMRGRVFSNGNVSVPPYLGANDLDWVGSRPLAQWSIGPRPGDYAWLDPWQNQPLDLIELSTADVIGVLCGGDDEKAPTAAPAHEVSRYPGRPTIKLAVLEKLCERAADGSMHDTLAAEARWLLEWAQRERAGESGVPSSPGVIENQVRDKFNALRGKGAIKAIK
jgi:hypothetical protein